MTACGTADAGGSRTGLMCMKVCNTTRGTVLAERACVARSFGRRLVGLMGRRKLDTGEALLIPRCSSIHTWFMRFPIDLIYLDESGHVVRIHARVEPFHLSWGGSRARDVLEIRAGAAAAGDTRPGDVIERRDDAG